MSIDLQRIPLPDEAAAEARAWAVVSRPYGEREPMPAPRRRGRPILVVAAAASIAALVAVAVSPAGSGIVRSVREAVGLKQAMPALTALPAQGRLLVRSVDGPWVVQADGSKRLLAGYRDASWSPQGLYLAVTRAAECLQSSQAERCTGRLPGRTPVTHPRWAPDGYRIAYLAGSTLRIVNGDGTGDRLFAEVAPVAGAWRPSETHEHVLAFSSARNELQLSAVDSNEPSARHRLPAPPRQLLWSDDGIAWSRGEAGASRSSTSRAIASGACGSPPALRSARWRGRRGAIAWPWRSARGE